MKNSEPNLENRRPLDSRNTKWASKITSYLADSEITPNDISVISMVAALFAGLAFWVAGAVDTHWLAVVFLILGALGCQLRLLCNLFDGMLAVEAGRSAADGPFWNEFPDRVSDILIFAGIGFAVGAPALGFAAAAFSVLTAYTRELGSNVGLAPDFTGPMAKQHRMAVVTGAAIIAIFFSKIIILKLALWIVIIGALGTTVRRAINIRENLLANDAS